MDTAPVWLTCSDPAWGEFVLLCHTVVHFLAWHGWGYEWGMKNIREIVIFRPCASFPGGRAYLCEDGSTTSERDQAARHWNIQFDAIVAENWIVNSDGENKHAACAEFV